MKMTNKKAGTSEGAGIGLKAFMEMVKEVLDFREIAKEDFNITSWQKDKAVKVLCPFHDDHRPSLALYADGYQYNSPSGYLKG